jgi:hypothetical protein
VFLEFGEAMMAPSLGLNVLSFAVLIAGGAPAD